MEPVFANYAPGGTSRLDPNNLEGFIGNYTWATKPNAALVPVGSRFCCTDVGVGGRSFWWSDGSVWHPVNGVCNLYSIAGTVANPVGTLSLNGNTQVFTLPQPQLIPAGMLYAGARLQLRASFIRAGVAGAVTPRIGGATAFNTMTQIFKATSLAAVAGQNIEFFTTLSVRTATAQSINTFGNTNTSQAAGNIVDVNANMAADYYITYGVVSGTAGTAPDTLDLISADVTMFG